MSQAACPATSWPAPHDCALAGLVRGTEALAAAVLFFAYLAPSKGIYLSGIEEASAWIRL